MQASPPRDGGGDGNGCGGNDGWDPNSTYLGLGIITNSWVYGGWTKGVEVVAIVGVVDVGAAKVVDGARVRGSRPCFLGLPYLV